VEHRPAVGGAGRVRLTHDLENPPFSIRSPQANGPGLGHSRLEALWTQDLTSRLEVLGVDELEHDVSFEPGRLPAQDPNGRGAQVAEAAIRVQHGDEIQGVLDQRPEVGLAAAKGLLGLPALHDMAPLSQGPLDDVRHLLEGEPRLHDVVEGALAHGLDRHLLVPEARHDNDRESAPPSVSSKQLGAVSVGQAEVRDDDVGGRCVNAASGFGQRPDAREI